MENNLKDVGYILVMDQISMIKPYIEKHPELKIKAIEYNLIGMRCYK
jgi:hypothetical protein